MYDYIHEPAQYLRTCLDGKELQILSSLPLDQRKAIIYAWKRIDTLIFRTNSTKGNN